MNNQNLIQLIRESIQNYISEIDHAGENAACEAKINAIGEAITLREKKMNMDGLDEAYHDMLDKGKMKELASEIKVLKKSLAKYEKQLEKLKSKGNSKIEKVKDTEKEEIIDETSLNENSPIGGGSFFDKEDLNDAWREIEDEVMEDLGYNDEDLKDPSADNKLYKITSDRFLTKYGKTFSEFAQDLPSKLEYEDEEDKEAEFDFGPDNLDPAGGYGPSSYMEEDMNIQEVLYMQKIAGIITEDEFIAKLKEANTSHEFLTVINLNKATTQEYFDYIVNSARNLYDFEVNSADFDQKEITIYGDHADVFKNYSNINSIKVLDSYDDDEFDMNEAKKPSAGMTKKEKSAVSKKAHAGKDIGKKGKSFEKIEKAVGGGEKGKKIAAAAMWKSEAKKAKSLKEEVLALFEDEILNESVFFLNDAGVNLLMDKGKYMTKPGSSTGVYVVYDLSKPKGKSSFGDDDEAQKVGVWFSKDTKRPNQLETEDENMIKIFKDDKYNVKK